MMKKIVYNREDGRAIIVHPAGDDVIPRIMGELSAGGYSPIVIDDSFIPADRYFRNAWVVSSNTVNVDMNQALNIHVNNLRVMRDPLLKALDIQYLQSIEANNVSSQASIIAQKVALRNITTDPSLAAAKTPDQLKATIPAALLSVSSIANA